MADALEESLAGLLLMALCPRAGASSQASSCLLLVHHFPELHLPPFLFPGGRWSLDLRPDAGSGPSRKLKESSQDGLFPLELALGVPFLTSFNDGVKPAAVFGGEGAP